MEVVATKDGNQKGARDAAVAGRPVAAGMQPPTASASRAQAKKKKKKKKKKGKGQ